MVVILGLGALISEDAFYYNLKNFEISGIIYIEKMRKEIEKMSKNTVRITDYELKYRIDFGGDDGIDTFLQFFDSMDELLYTASKLWAFDDCCPVEILSIKADGHELRYCGWRPGMEYSYYDVETGEEVWTRHFPEWDH